jgi:hypothetical protein
MLRDHVDELRQCYDETYGHKFGLWRAELDREIEKYLKCGIPRFGFARVKCKNPACGAVFALAFSCKAGLCPSCRQKRMLETEMWIVDHILKEVPHRHFVFTIPKLLRPGFMRNREALTDLSRIAWECTLTFYQEGLSEIFPLGEGTPAAAQGIETSGEYLAPNPHVHVLAADGLFSACGKFYQLPRCDEGSRIYLLSLWKKAVSAFAMEKGFITPEMMGKILNWQHTGFSVFAERRVDFKWSDEESVKQMRHLARYIAKPPFALENITWKEGADKVIYRGERVTSYHPQNFETFDVLDFLAAIVGHIPLHRQKYVLYYGHL